MTTISTPTGVAFTLRGSTATPFVVANDIDLGVY